MEAKMPEKYLQKHTLQPIDALKSWLNLKVVITGMYELTGDCCSICCLQLLHTV